MEIEYPAGYRERPPGAGREGYRAVLGRRVGGEYCIPDTWSVGKKHPQAVDPETRARGRRQAVFQRSDVVGVVVHGLLVARLLGLRLLEEARRLVLGIVQLREAVGDLLRVDEKLEAIDDSRVLVVAAGERRDLGREFRDEGGLRQVLLRHCLEQH